MTSQASVVAPDDGGARPEAEVTIAPLGLRGSLVRPAPGRGLVLFAHGGSRLSPRDRLVASRLQQAGLGTLLFDLLLDDEAADRRNVFDIPLLAERLVLTTHWVRSQEGLGGAPLGYFGASTGVAAALAAAAITSTSHRVAAIVSSGGRPDLAGIALPLVRAATLLIVGKDDHGGGKSNEAAFARLACAKEFAVVPGAGHLFEEPGTLDMVVALARGWFLAHLGTDCPR